MKPCHKTTSNKAEGKGKKQQAKNPMKDINLKNRQQGSVHKS